MVVVGLLAAHIDHAVDGGAAAEHAPARIVERAAGKAFLTFRAEAPVGARIAHAVEITDGNAHPDVIVLAARLEQQHAHLGIGRQTIGQHTARGAAADDDEVVSVSEGSGLGHIAL